MFSGAGVGDVGLEAAGFTHVVANELVDSRADLLALNLPSAKVVRGDATELVDEICQVSLSLIRNQGSDGPYLLFATPPCQGMSPNGMGKLLNNARRGLRPGFDPRNRLILPALAVASRLRPRWVIFENVGQMQNTVIEEDGGSLVRIVDLIPRTLGQDYSGAFYEVEFADYGLPQRRKRLITVYTRDDRAKASFSRGHALIPPRTHARYPCAGLRPWVSLKEAIGQFPVLDAKSKATASDAKNPMHSVPVLDPKKYEWIRHTPENGSAFDNQCINPDCMFQENPRHGAARDGNGINRAREDTPLHCERCGSLLPRPFVQDSEGTMRFMRGYTSAYKRMSWDLPASTLTQNLRYPSSDHTLHPTQNRVLSLAEANKIQSISEFDYRWGPVTIDGELLSLAPATLIAECIGESVPPLFTHLLGNHVVALTESPPEGLPALEAPGQLPLWVDSSASGSEDARQIK